MPASPFPFEIVSRPLEREEVLGLFEKSAATLASIGATALSVTLGWSCREEEAWEPHEITVGALVGFARGVAERGAYRPGESDLHLEDPDGRFELRFCHEADLHFECSERAMFDAVRAAWVDAELEPKIVREM